MAFTAHQKLQLVRHLKAQVDGYKRTLSEALAQGHAGEGARASLLEAQDMLDSASRMRTKG